MYRCRTPTTGVAFTQPDGVRLPACLPAPLPACLPACLPPLPSVYLPQGLVWRGDQADGGQLIRVQPCDVHGTLQPVIHDL